MRASPVPEIVAFGEPMIEFNQSAGDGRYVRGHGGDTSNCIIAAARAGAAAGYVTALGCDAFGDDFMRLWEENGVDTAHVKRDRDAFTAAYFVSHGADGHAFHYLRKGSAASRFGPADMPEDYLARARLLHLSGISLGISESACDAGFAAIAVARQHGALVSFDTNLRLALWPLDRARAVIHAAMALCDIALPSLDDALHLTGFDNPDRIADFYLDLGAKVVALTLGARGSFVATAEERRHVAGIRVDAVDATGAGDTFDGSFLAEYLSSGDPFAAGRYANVAAALATRGYGAVAPIPHRAVVAAAIAGLAEP